MPLSLGPGLTLYFCRHGETVANIERRFQGHTKDTPLTARGREQAAALARLLARLDADFARFEFVSSPLRRARATTEIIRETLGLNTTDYSVEPRIAEIDLGRWDGLTDAEARALDPAFYDRRQSDKWDVRVPGGENYADVAKRCKRWFSDLRADAFAVSHGAFTRILRGLVQGLTWKEMSDLDEKQGVLFRVREDVLERFESDV